VPGWGQIVPVYAVIVLIVYGWTITWFSWRFPGWLLFLKASEILIVLPQARRILGNLPHSAFPCPESGPAKEVVP
jgi:hypothetical protein